MNDQELAAEARRVAAKLRGSRSDLGRLAGALLAELADRLDGHAAQATEDVHVIREGTLAGPLILDPRYTPPWPGAGIKSIRKGDAFGIGTGRENEAAGDQEP